MLKPLLFLAVIALIFVGISLMVLKDWEGKGE
jgi:hypothetical protein